MCAPRDIGIFLLMHKQQPLSHIILLCFTSHQSSMVSHTQSCKQSIWIFLSLVYILSAGYHTTHKFTDISAIKVDEYLKLLHIILSTGFFWRLCLSLEGACSLLVCIQTIFSIRLFSYSKIPLHV